MDRDDLEEPEENERTPFLDHTINNFKEGINTDEIVLNPKISQENEMPIDNEDTEALLENEDINNRLLDVIRHNILYAYFFKNNGINYTYNNKYIDSHKPFSIFIIPVTVCIITTIYLSLWIKYDGCKTKYHTTDGFYQQCKTTYDCINATITGKTFIPTMNPDYTSCDDYYCQYFFYLFIIF